MISSSNIFERFGNYMPLFIIFWQPVINTSILSQGFFIDQRSKGISISIGCPVGIRTWACQTADRQTTLWATPHPELSYAAPLLNYPVSLNELRRTLRKLF
jgi:hypothetical protein